MKFKKYQSIENSYRQKYLELLSLNGLDDKQFYVEEKIHGANFSFYYDGKSIKTGKRNGFLGENSTFYNSNIILKDNRQYILNLFNIIKNYDESMNEIVVYGELFGGHYPHKDVNINHTSKKIQKGVCYTPDNMFIAFDILINEEYKLNESDLKKIFEESGILYSKTLFKGTLNECINYPNIYQTTIPSILGLPEIENNICEGNVIKPISPLFINNTRVILKNKNDKFTEKQRTPKVKVEVSEKLVDIFDKVNEYINENRYNSVVSKLGEVTISDFSSIIKLMVSDVYEDSIRDIIEIKTLNKSEHKLLSKFMSKQCANIIKKCL